MQSPQLSWPPRVRCSVDATKGAVHLRGWWKKQRSSERFIHCFFSLYLSPSSCHLTLGENCGNYEFKSRYGEEIRTCQGKSEFTAWKHWLMIAYWRRDFHDEGWCNARRDTTEPSVPWTQNVVNNMRAVRRRRKQNMPREMIPWRKTNFFVEDKNRGRNHEKPTISSHQ